MRIFNPILGGGPMMTHHDHYGEHDTVCVQVAILFIAVLVALFVIGMIN